MERTCGSNVRRIRTGLAADAAPQRADERQMGVVVLTRALLFCGGHREGSRGADDTLAGHAAACWSWNTTPCSAPNAAISSSKSPNSALDRLEEDRPRLTNPRP